MPWRRPSPNEPPKVFKGSWPRKLIRLPFANWNASPRLQNPSNSSRVPHHYRIPVVNLGDSYVRWANPSLVENMLWVRPVCVRNQISRSIWQIPCSICGGEDHSSGARDRHIHIEKAHRLENPARIQILVQGKFRTIARHCDGV